MKRLRDSCVSGAFVAAMLWGLPSAQAIVVSDDFSDLNDTANPTWVHINGTAGSTGQIWDASAGKYRLYAPSDGAVPGIEGYGFVASYVEPSFNDVRVTADIVDFPNTGPFGSNFGIAARLDGDNGPIFTGFDTGLKGYSYQYEASAAGGEGEMVLSLLWAGGPKDIGSQKVSLDNTKDYRFVLEVVGSVLHGQVFELDAGGNVVAMVGERFRDVVNEPIMLDHDADPGTDDIVHELYTSGYSGAYAYGHVFYTDGDMTLDNFRSETAVAGDYNRNGAVDAADYTVWRDSLGSMGPEGNPPFSFGDLRANGAVDGGAFQTIDQADYDFWASNFGLAAGNGSGLNSGVVPEPLSVSLIAMGLLGVCLGTRRARYGCRSGRL